MHENRNRARQILSDAAEQVTVKGREHGAAFDSFNMIGGLWGVYLDHLHIKRSGADTAIQPHDVAQMMVLVKIARAMYGYSDDNFIDAAGYTALAAMLIPSPLKVSNEQKP